MRNIKIDAARVANVMYDRRLKAERGCQRSPLANGSSAAPCPTTFSLLLVLFPLLSSSVLGFKRFTCSKGQSPFLDDSTADFTSLSPLQPPSQLVATMSSGPSSVPLTRPTPSHQPQHLRNRPPYLDLHHNPLASTSAAANMNDAPQEPSQPQRQRQQLGKPFVPFNMAEVAAAAMARPRSIASWADRDETSHCPDSPSSSAGSSPFSSAPGSPITQPSSCALTPSSSSEGFTLSAPRPPPKAPVETRPLPAPPVASTSLITPPLPPSDDWSATDFSLKLLFTFGNSSTSPSASSSSTDEEDHSLPPAFFPSARISFSPRLRITSPNGLPYSSLGGMHLGVTGMCETLDGEGKVKSKRMIADFCIDLTSGLGIWKRDAQAARKRSGKEVEEEGRERLPPGTYVLPLSMKIPNSDRL